MNLFLFFLIILGSNLDQPILKPSGQSRELPPADIMEKDSEWPTNAQIIETAVYTEKHIGAGQGGSFINNKIYLYGDLEDHKPRVGIIREYDLNLKFTGRQILGMRNKKVVFVHPAGLSVDPKWGALIGDAFNGKSSFHRFDFEMALKDGNLDRAWIDSIEDDVAIKGGRPLFIPWHGKTRIVSADYGDQTPQIRIYDPEKLFKEKKSSAPGVLLHRISANAFNQNLLWDQESKSLICVQNVTAGRGWRLEYWNLSKAINLKKGESPVSKSVTYPPHDELEGYIRLPNGKEVFITSGSVDNIVVGETRLY